MPKAPVQAQIVIGLFAVLVIAYGFAIVRLDGTSSGTRSVVAGQLIVVRIERASISLKTSDPWVVAPVSLSHAPQTLGYFVAVTPGRASLSAVLTPPCGQCLAATVLWSVEV